MSRPGPTFVFLTALSSVSCARAPDDCEATRSCSPSAKPSPFDGAPDSAGSARSLDASNERSPARPRDGGSKKEAAADAGGSDGGRPAVERDGSGTANDATPDAANDAPRCDEARSPKDEPCLVSSRFGVFVAPNGTGGGTMESPLGSIAEALVVARATGRRKIIVCGEFAFRYRDPLVLTSKDSGLGLFGGFRCPSDGGAAWAYDGAVRNGIPRTMAAPASPAITLTDVTDLVVEDIGFAALSGSSPSASSIGAIVSNSVGVTFRRVLFAGSSGAPGADGADVELPASAAPVAGTLQNGKDSVCVTAGSAPPIVPGGSWSAPSACGSKGGDGASANAGDNASAASTPGSPFDGVIPSNFNNSGESQWQTAGGGVAALPGLDGAVGADGSLGAASAALGIFTASGYAPADGHDGSDGHVGQGGGGGGASKSPTAAPYCAGASGGAGGMGGCGGAAGPGGRGGGASVGLLLWDSAVVLEDAVVMAQSGGKGGKGGNGGAPSSGQPGGIGGKGASTSNGVIPPGGPGGRGGTGGAGGPGSGGSGGPSVSLVFHRAAPIEVGTTTFNVVAGGDPGLGGTAAGVFGIRTAPGGTKGAATMRYEQK
jgi:hypothetical protein